MKYFALFIELGFVLFCCTIKKEDKGISVNTVYYSPFVYNDQNGSIMVDVCITNSSEYAYKINCRNGFTKNARKYTSKFLLRDRASGNYMNMDAMVLLDEVWVAPGYSHCFYVTVHNEDIAQKFNRYKGLRNIKLLRKHYQLYFVDKKDTLTFE